jgi:PA14 domain
MKRVARCVVVLGLCVWRPAPAQRQPVPTFGTTVVIPSGLRGEIYFIRPNSTRLPNFKKLKKPTGIIYTESLNVPPQNWLAGFPGVTDRFEWFAINYTGKFWIENPGKYHFSLTSDDGAKLYIDDRLIIDNDGLHSPVTQEGTAKLAGGIHRLHVPYFQGPRSAVALVLQIAAPGEDLRLFSTEEFKPPPNPADWKFPEN